MNRARSVSGDRAADGAMTGEERDARPGLVSVITIFLDAKAFLEEAIGSVLAQTYADWELLLVDDGSTDGSTALARQYAEQHPARVRYLEHPEHRNLGMSASRNLGILEARGEFIALLDADDVWLPGKLERQVAVLRQSPRAGMTYGPTVLWYGWTGSADDAARDYVTSLPARPGHLVPGPKVLARILRQRGSPVYTCSVLARRDAVLAVGGFEDRFRGLFEDQAFFSKFLLAHPVHITSEPLDRYRQHADSCCGGVDDPPATTPAMRDARINYLRWLSSYLAGRNAPLRVRRAVATELWLERHPAAARMRGAVRTAAGVAYARSVRAAFAVGRSMIPRAVRQRLWHVVTRGR
jgi:glycosyltransferase involved in cell wall biosynthesis